MSNSYGAMQEEFEKMKYKRSRQKRLQRLKQDIFTAQGRSDEAILTRVNIQRQKRGMARIARGNALMTKEAKYQEKLTIITKKQNLLKILAVLVQFLIYLN